MGAGQVTSSDPRVRSGFGETHVLSAHQTAEQRKIADGVRKATGGDVDVQFVTVDPADPSASDRLKC